MAPAVSQEWHGHTPTNLPAAMHQSGHC